MGQRGTTAALGRKKEKFTFRYFEFKLLMEQSGTDVLKNGDMRLGLTQNVKIGVRDLGVYKFVNAGKFVKQNRLQSEELL